MYIYAVTCSELIYTRKALQDSTTVMLDARPPLPGISESPHEPPELNNTSRSVLFNGTCFLEESFPCFCVGGLRTPACKVYYVNKKN